MRFIHRKLTELYFYSHRLRDYLNKQSELDKEGGGGAATRSKDDDKEEDADAEKKKLRGALSGAIVTEKPGVSSQCVDFVLHSILHPFFLSFLSSCLADVKWEDVAGLENAKDSLKEVSLTVSAI